MLTFLKKCLQFGGAFHTITNVKKHYQPQTILDAVIVLFLIFTPVTAYGEGVSASSASAASSSLPDIVLTEVQTGSATSGKDEFVELYNSTASSIDISGWQLRYLSATSSTVTLDKPTTTITITSSSANSTGDGSVLVPAHGYFVLHTASTSLPTGADGQVYAYTLPASGGSVVLLQPDSTDCTLQIVDAFAWGGGAWGEGAPYTPASSKDQIMQRGVNTGSYADTNSNAADFVGFAANTTPNPATPGSANTQATTSAVISTPTGMGQGVSGTKITNTNCTLPVSSGGTSGSGSGSSDDTGITAPTESDTPPATVDDNSGSSGTTSGDAQDTTGTTSSASNQSSASSTASPTIPAADVGLTAPQITELLPNPGSPKTDSSDEFIELYNSNAVPFDLSGFKLEVGLTTKHYFTFVAGTKLPARTSVAFYSADTGLSMSNSGGEVWLLDPYGNILGQSDEYGTAKDDQAWALANGKWYWTTTPTPNAANVVTAASTAAKKKSSSSSSSTKSKSASSKATKATAAKATKSKSTATKTAASTMADTSEVASNSPIHPVVLAVAAGFALLYGGYEYRRDLANKYYQFRRYRAARREARQELARR